MKAMHYIIGVAMVALAFSACDDEPAIDKAVIDGFNSEVTVNARQMGSYFQVQWDNLRLFTKDGAPIVIIGNPSYNVCASIFDVYTESNSNYFVIKNVTGTSTTVSIDEIVTALGQDALDKQIQFGVFLVNGQNDVMLNSFSASMKIDTDWDSGFTWGFEMDNKWFVEGGSVLQSSEHSGTVVIEVDRSGDPWNAQFCNVFHNLSGNQKVGELFELSFDVMWAGEYSSEPVSISIMTAKNNEHYRWYDENTELLQSDGSNIKQKDNILLQDRRFTTVTLDGIIGEAGSENIGIQINLAGDKDYDESSLGSFYFKNMTVKMGGRVVAEYYKERTQGDYYLGADVVGNGQVLGAGYYDSGEEVELTAVPGVGYFFDGWKDGEYNNPRRVKANSNSTYTAIFRRTDED